MQEPPYFYVRERTSPAAHHWDYLNDRTDEALCGHGYDDPITLGEVTRPKSVCRACQGRLHEYHAKWWREQSQAVSSELEELRAQLDELGARYRKLVEHSNNQRTHLATLQSKLRTINEDRQKASAPKTRPQKSSGADVVSKKRRPKPTSVAGAKKKQRPKSVASPFASRLGIPSVNKQQVELDRTERTRRAADPEKVQKRVKELLAPQRHTPKSAGGKGSDQAARDRMRSQKASTWRLGRSPGSYR